MFDPQDHQIAGGSGIDTLRVSGAGITIAPTTALSGIEIIELGGSGDNQLIMTASEIAALSDTDQLTVFGDAGDKVFTTGGWAFANTTLIDGLFFDVFTAGGTTLRLQQGMARSIDDAGDPGVITLLGDGADNTLYGTVGSELIQGFAGNDFINGGLGADQLQGDAGDDRLVFDPNDTVIDGGSDFDTLLLRGDGIVLDFDLAISDNLAGFEQIDLSGPGANAVSLGIADVLDLSDTNLLRIIGSAGDTAVSEGENWVLAPDTVSADGMVFHSYAAGGATLLVETELISFIS